MRRTPALVLAILLISAPARAAWQPGGNPIGPLEQFVATASGSGRVIVAWTRYSASGHTQVRMQAWTADGDVAPGWPSQGVLASDLAGMNMAPSICEDGTGGAFVAWLNDQSSSRGLYLQHVSGAGNVPAGWPAGGLALSTASPYTTRLATAHDGAGGALVGIAEYFPAASSSSVRVHRIDANGAPNAGWPLGGLTIPSAYEVALAVDAEHHVFMSTSNYNPGTLNGLRVQRLDGTGTPDPTWPQGGALIGRTYPIVLKLFPDGAGGVFTGWELALVCVASPCPPPARWAARVLGNGSPDDRWAPGRAGLSNAPDGAGGMLLGLETHGRPGALRLDAGGAAMPGWAPQGNAAMTEVVDPWYVLVTDDGEEGAFVAWSDHRAGEPRLYASRLDARGQLASGWPATGSLVSPRAFWGNPIQLVSLGKGLAVAVWQEWTHPAYSGYLLALRPGEPGPLAPLGPVQQGVGFGGRSLPSQT